jgi:penicillin-binding protein 1C
MGVAQLVRCVLSRSNSTLAGLCVALCIALGAGAFMRIPVNLAPLKDVSRSLLASDGTVLEMRLNSRGYWREPVALEDIDPRLVRMLVAYEDRRFYHHSGVDLLAFGRAFRDVVTTGRITSGASTLTMQLARLLHPNLNTRSISGKLQQMALAWRLGHQLSKSQVLEAYFTLAPYGGNLEGIVAASRAWFGKTPSRLTLSEIGLLVALPQAPETRRPDRYPMRAFRAKNRVLSLVSDRIGIEPLELAELQSETIARNLLRPLSTAPHLFDRLLLAQRSQTVLSTIDADMQAHAAEVLSAYVAGYQAPINGAILIAERGSGAVQAYVGSSSYNNRSRKGAVNYLMARRSPGSTLKPLIYAEALDRRAISLDQVFDDRPILVDGYRPSNFNNKYDGRIGLKQALLSSKNIAAIETLQKVGFEHFEAKYRRTFQSRDTGVGTAGLAMAVGGLYLTPEQLAETYLMMANDGVPVRLTFETGSQPYEQSAFISAHAANSIMALLGQHDSFDRLVTLKTGTSHNKQDAWAAMITGRHVVIVWLGMPDNEPTKILTGASVARPLALRLADVLELQAANFEMPQQMRLGRRLMKKACPKLISHPKDGAVIYQEGNVLPVRSNLKDTVWYLNGKRAMMNKQNIVVKHGGFHWITATHEGCKNTVEIELR